MASYMVARQSARRSNRPLVYVQAVDEPKGVSTTMHPRDLLQDMLRVPSLSQTKRLPGVVLFHHGMRMRLTTTISDAAPFAVQDVECTVVGFDVEAADSINSSLRTATSTEMRCTRLPKAVYVKLDDCEHRFLTSIAIKKPCSFCLEHWIYSRARCAWYVPGCCVEVYENAKRYMT